MTQEHHHHHHHHHQHNQDEQTSHHHHSETEEVAQQPQQHQEPKAAAPKLPLALRKSIRDEFDPYVSEFQADTEKYLGSPWTMDVPWEVLVHANTQRGMKEHPGSFVRDIFKNLVYQFKILTKEGKDKATVDAINSNCSSHVATIALDSSVPYCGSKLENGVLVLLFKDGDNIGMNSSQTLEGLPSKLNTTDGLSLLVRKSIRDEFEPYVSEFESKSKALFGQPWSMEIPWAMLLEKADSRGFSAHPGNWIKGIIAAALVQLSRLTNDGKDSMVVESVTATVTAKTIAIDVDDSIPRWCGCKIDDGKLVLLFKGGKDFGSNQSETLDKLQDMLQPGGTDSVPEAKFPLTVRKNIRDHWEPYVSQFAEDTKKLLGEPWTAEPNFALAVEQGSTMPGGTLKGIFSAAVDQLKRLTKDGKDDMLVEALQEAVPEKTMIFGLDDSIKGWSYCKLEDGKLWLLFKSGPRFNANITESLRDLEKML